MHRTIDTGMPAPFDLQMVFNAGRLVLTCDTMLLAQMQSRQQCASGHNDRQHSRT